MSLRESSRSGFAEDASNPPHQDAAKVRRSFSADGKSLLVILSIATIATTSGWIYCLLHPHQVEICPRVEHAPPLVGPKLAPWCPPERTGCLK
jgi:hypothetical protein